MSDEILRIRRAAATSVSLPIALLQDSRLSYRARGVLCFLLSFTEETMISTADLALHGKEGRDAARTALAELRDVGYVEQNRTAYHDERGRQRWCWETLVSDTPLPKTDSQGSETVSESEIPKTDFQASNEAGFSGFMSITTTSSTQSSLDTSYQDSPSTDVPVRKGRSGWDGVPSAKRTSRKRKAAADDRDPSDITRLLDDGSQPEPEIDLEAGRQKVAQKRATRSQGPAERLARSFGTIATQEGVQGVPGETNIGALGKAFADWRRNGTPDEVIRRMIEHYWSPLFAPFRSADKTAWVDFLAQRGRLFADCTRHAVEAARQDDAFWEKRPEGTDDDSKYDPANWALPADIEDDAKYDPSNWT